MKLFYIIILSDAQGSARFIPIKKDHCGVLLKK